MGYVIAAVIVLVLIAGFVAFVVLTSSRRNAGGGRRDPAAASSEDGGPPGIASDHTPLGDTAEHAGEQTAEGTTVAGQDADRHGGTDRPGATPPRTR